MEDKVFLDTGGLFALLNDEECETTQLAKALFKNFDNLGYKIFTTDYVLEELVTLLRCREKVPITDIFQFLHNLYITDLNVVEIGREYFGKGLIFMYQYKDHFFSLTDCTSFVVMKEFKIKEAFTTDEHFEIAGFKKLL